MKKGLFVRNVVSKDWLMLMNLHSQNCVKSRKYSQDGGLITTQNVRSVVSK